MKFGFAVVEKKEKQWVEMLKMALSSKVLVLMLPQCFW